MAIYKSSKHPTDCAKCGKLITTSDYRIINDFGSILCFECMKKKRKTGFFIKFMEWLGLYAK